MSTGKFNINRFEETTVGRTKVISPATTDGLANVGESVISFLHVPSENDIFFKAFIQTFNESYSTNYNQEEVFGRNDPIYTFRNTNRTIALSWKIPAETISEAYENLTRVQELAQFLYPTYQDIRNALTLSQSPLIRLKVMNLAQRNGQVNSRGGSSDADTNLTVYKSTNDASEGVLGVITSLNIRHNLEDPTAGVIQTKKNTILPKMIDVDISFNVIHETPLGYTKNGTNQDFQSPQFPYNANRPHPERQVQLSDQNNNGTSYDERQDFLRALEQQREQAEQDRANAKARNYRGLFGRRRLKKDTEYVNDSNNKNHRNFDYIASAVRGENATLDIYDIEYQSGAGNIVIHENVDVEDVQ